MQIYTHTHTLYFKVTLQKEQSDGKFIELKVTIYC